MRTGISIFFFPFLCYIPSVCVQDLVGIHNIWKVLTWYLTYSKCSESVTYYYYHQLLIFIDSEWNDSFHDKDKGPFPVVNMCVRWGETGCERCDLKFKLCNTLKTSRFSQEYPWTRLKPFLSLSLLFICLLEGVTVSAILINFSFSIHSNHYNNMHLANQIIFWIF